VRARSPCARSLAALIASIALLSALLSTAPAGAQEAVTLSVGVRGNATGVVTSDLPGIECPEICEAAFPVGTVVFLAATPDPGSIFMNWGGACSGTEPCELILDADRTVTARFGDTYRSGAMIRRADATGYRGRRIVDPTAGPKQTVRAKAARGQTAAFVVRVENQGAATDSLLVAGTGDRGGASVRYRSGGEDVTAAVTGGTFLVPDLAPGRGRTIRVVVQIASGAKIGAERAWMVSVASVAEPTSADAVRAEVRVVWRPVPLARAVGVTLVEPGRSIGFAAYHESLFSSAVALDPLGDAIVMASRDRGTPPTSAVDVVMDAGQSVLAPVTGRVASVTRYRLYCDIPDVRIVIRPADDPTRTVLVLHVASVRVSRGDRVRAGRSMLGVPRDLGLEDQVDDYGAAGRPHVHLEIEGDGSSPLPGCR
jgi:hypothetical protein